MRVAYTGAGPVVRWGSINTLEYPANRSKGLEGANARSLSA